MKKIYLLVATLMLAFSTGAFAQPVRHYNHQVVKPHHPHYYHHHYRHPHYNHHNRYHR